MAHSDSVAFAVQSAKDLQEPLPEPPLPLDENAVVYWEQVLRSKPLSNWTPSDLLIACTLCRDLAAVEVLQEEIAEFGPVLVNEKKRRYSNPACNLLDQAQRRILAATRGLQIHAVATQGKTDHQGNKVAAARELAKKVDDADDLIARPGRLN